MNARLSASLLTLAGLTLTNGCGGRTTSSGNITNAAEKRVCGNLGTSADPGLAGWSLVWHDEFDVDGLPNASYWGYDTGNSGFGNNEAETYYADNLQTARVECGTLVVTTSRSVNGTRTEYPSARLKTLNKVSWKYGRIEARAKLPSGIGTWPAIWMLPEKDTYGGWPRSGEIDIMEHVGFDPNVIHGTVHTEAFNHTIGTQKGDQIRVPTALTEFHVYAIEWSADRIDFFVDGTKYFSFTNAHTGSAAWPFDQPFFLLINTAVGGSWGGQQGIDNSIFPQKMLVDYVRVYARS
jgi:beta-glucanase (GH16 family)